jgi:hypothetical protein
MLFAPSRHRAKNGTKRLAVPGKGIFDARRDLRKDLAADDVVRFELAKLLCKHFLCGTGNEAVQLTKAARAAFEIVKNEGFPFTANDSGGETDRTIHRMHEGSPRNQVTERCLLAKKRLYSKNAAEARPDMARREEK